MEHQHFNLKKKKKEMKRDDDSIGAGEHVLLTLIMLLIPDRHGSLHCLRRQ